MKRLVLVPIIALASGFSPALAQTDNSTGTSNGPNETPNPQPPSIPACEDECGNSVDAEQSASGEYSCPSGTTEAENDSCGLKINLGLTTYSTSTNFLKHDQSLHIAPSKSYNPPCVGNPPFRKSLASDWGKQNKRPVCMMLRTTDPSTGTIKPNSFETYGHSKTDATGPGSWAGPYTERATPGTAYMKRDAATDDRFQVLSDQFLVDAKSENSTTVVRYYPKESAGQRDSSTGFHPVAPGAQTLKTVRISQPSPKVISVVQDENFSSFTAPKTRGFRWSIDGNTSVLTRHTGDPSICYPYERDRLTKTDLGNGTIQRVRTVDRAVTTNFPAGFHPTPPPPGYQPEQQDPPGGYATVSRTMEQYRDLGNGNLRIFKKVEGYQTPKEVTTEYTYTSNDGKWSVSSGGQSGPRYAGAVAPPPGYTGPLPGTVQAASATNDYLGSRIATLRRTDGYWEDYAYDFNPGTGTMLTRIWSCWKNSAPGDHASAKETIITLEENSRTVIEKIAGQLVSSEYEKLTVAADGTRTLREEKKSGANSTLVTETAYFPDNAAEPNNGRIKYIRHSDGTLTRYTYSIVPDITAPGKTALKTIKEKGAVDAAQFSPAATGPVPSLTMGTRTETITNSFEKVIDTKSYDIASGLLLEQAIATAVDNVGRPTHIIHDGDVNDYEEFTFACCGIKTHRARDGTLADFTMDALGRLSSIVVTLGPKTTATAYTYSTEELDGQTLPKTTVTRSISAGSKSTGSLLVTETMRDAEGRTLVSRSPDANGDNTPETTTYTYDPATHTDTSTGPDGITRTNTSYADGQTHTSVSTFDGNPITPLTTSDYAPHNLNGGGIKTTIQLSAGNASLKTENSFADLANRTFRSESPGYNGATLVMETTFDERGRVVSRSTTDGPATQRILNVLGQPTESWSDSNGDGQFNDTTVNGIKDTIRRTTTDFVTEDQTICQRTRQWVRDDANTDKLISTTFRSTDGTYQKSVPLPDTGPITVATATKPLNGNVSSETRTYLGSSLISPNLVSSVFATLGADGTTSTVSINKDTNGTVIKTGSQIFDLQGWTTAVIGERGLTTAYSDFTATGTPLKVTQSDGTYTITTLDFAAHPVKLETFNSSNTVISTVHTTYHPDGKVAANWGTNSNPTYKLYDLQGRLVEVRAYRSANLALHPTASTPDYDSTTWNYEPATGLLHSKRYADNKGPDYTYTPDGKLQTRTWARTSDGSQNRITTTYTYNPAELLTSTTYSDTTPDVSITYDRLGRQLSQSNGYATSEFTYNASTLALDTETITYDLNNDGNPDITRVLDRSRDFLGRDTGFQLKNGESIENEAIYQYSAVDGRLFKVSGFASTGLQSPEFTYTYVPNSHLIDTVTGPVHTVDNVWEPTRNVLATKQNKAGATVISQYDYTVNALGQRTSVSQTGAAFASTRGIDWGYDGLGQITSADSTNNPDDRAYTYDTIGNRERAITGTTDAADPSATVYTGNSLNQYSSIHDPQFTIFNPHHDADGNMAFGQIPAGSANLVWDAENRLTAAHINGQTVHYAYDTQGRRIATRRDGDASPSGPAQTTLYFYDGWNVVAEYFTANNSPITIHKTNLWGKDLSGTLHGAGGVGGLLSVTLNSQSSTLNYFPTFDGNGNISEYLESNDTVAAHFEYDPFGNTMVNTDIAGNFEYRFSTKSIDATTGLYYYGSRFYDPVTGRWPSRDPVLEQGFWFGRPEANWNIIALYYKYFGFGFIANQGIQYVFCGNSPLANIDINGEWIHIVCGAVIGGVMGWVGSGTWEGGLAGAVGGAVTAATFNPAAGASAGAIIAAGIGAGAAGGAASGVTQEAVNAFQGEGFDAGEVVESTAIGAVAGGLTSGGALGGGGTNAVKEAAEEITREVMGVTIGTVGGAMDQTMDAIQE